MDTDVYCRPVHDISLQRLVDPFHDAFCNSLYANASVNLLYYKTLEGGQTLRITVGGIQWLNSS